MTHKFGPVQHTSPDNDQPYRKCELCGRVMFEYGDDYFDTNCHANDRESLRAKLERNK